MSPPRLARAIANPAKLLLAACPVLAAFLGADADGATDDGVLGNGVAWGVLERALAVGECRTEVEALIVGRDVPLIGVGSTHGFDERTRHWRGGDEGVVVERDDAAALPRNGRGELGRKVSVGGRTPSSVTAARQAASETWASGTSRARSSRHDTETAAIPTPPSGGRTVTKSRETSWRKLAAEPPSAW